MAHAWLDSLSEDWVSQPGSDASSGQLPLADDAQADTSQIRDYHSRIPRRAANAKSSAPATSANSPSILSERSANDINISSSKRRLPSKLSQQIKHQSNAGVSRSVSNMTSGSVVHNNLSSPTSPGKEGETPEWRRRLVYGDIPYGEQRDLFCSAAAGLQDMFKPPPPADEPTHNEVDDAPDGHEITLPSSPPTYPQPITEADIDEFLNYDDEEDVDYPVDVTPSPSPRRLQKEITYKLDESSPIPNLRPSNQPQRGITPVGQPGVEVHQSDGCLTAPCAEDDLASRKASGQSDMRNEDFSPILIGKHSGEYGHVDFAPIDVPVDQLWQKLERLRVNQLLLDSQADLQTGFDASPRQLVDVETTEDFMHNGGFINAKRGGRSGDGSFYNRGLSSDIGVDTSEMLPEESLQASTPKEFPSVRSYGTNPFPTLQLPQSPALPRAPFPSPDKNQLAAQNDTATSSGSPLKLFGPYDTFTNQTLLRRISQFEERSGSPSNQSVKADSAVNLPRNEAESKAGKHQSRNFSHFGEGDLDGYEFTGDLSDEIYEDSDVVDKENIAPQPQLPAYPLRNFQPRDSSPDSPSVLDIRRRRSKNDTMPRDRPGDETPESARRYMLVPGESATSRRDPESESKRPRTSPSKDPTPKRRRTLHRSDIAFGRDAQLQVVDKTNVQMHLMTSNKKRKDALPGGFELADADVLAQRSILQPRSPGSLSGRSSDSYVWSEKSPKRALRADATMPSSDGPTETVRKPSIRTQDFVDQAAQIMAMIRNQVKPDLASLEESEEHDDEEKAQSLSHSYQESTNEPFSRPPSREGNPVSWIPPRQDDPELMSKLKKYQDFSDMGDVISSSVRSASLAKNAILAAQDLERQAEKQSRNGTGPIPIVGEVVSDLPNVRITSNPMLHGSPSKDYHSNSSNRSSSRTYPSAGSSRGSESRRTIMAQSVSHLIPDQVGSMHLDKQTNKWVKRKETEPVPHPEVNPSDESEDDPFGSIPDLSVDMTKEMQNLRLATLQKVAESKNQESDGSPSSPSRNASTLGYLTVSPNQYQYISTENMTGQHDADGGDIWEDEDEEQQQCEPGRNGQDDKWSTSQSTKRRNLTISFSSPIASVIRDQSPDSYSPDDFSGSQNDDGSPHSSPSRSPSQPAAAELRGSTTHAGRRGSSRVPHRQPSIRDPAFIPRPVSRIDEQDEESTVDIDNDHHQLSIIGEQSMISHKTPDTRRASLSFVFNQTPGYGALTFAADDSALIGRNVGKLSLSPLSEFTLNHPDQSFGFEVSYVMGPRHMETGDGSKKVLSMTIRELVERLGEAEPHESFWEDITQLDLHDKHLASLHMLDEFCGKLVTLDASGNKLNHLDGIPSTVRELKLSRNFLTELTSWDHLMNLQYVDISDNEVTSLSALKNLVHLRSIKADNNQLTSLDGLDCHAGLLSLRARNNMIEELDFASVKFERLEELDLGGNYISSVRNLDLLPALSKLKLPKNRLTEMPKTGCLNGLRHLDVSDNELEMVDISCFPNLHSIHADRNFIYQISGFEKARRLDSLSLREQRGDDYLDLGFLSSAYEVRKMFLSGNYLPGFDPKVDFLNLQLLELANCGLQALPESMGQLMPNLRTLNINFNAISDLSPLQFIPRMKKLLAAGNRLADSTSATQLLTEFPHLTQLDVRDNPVTLGFYPPLQVLVSTNEAGHTDPFVLPEADSARDETFASRLDAATRLRRRLQQVVLVASCRRLKLLDGLRVRRRDVFAQDELLRRLITDGLVPDPNAAQTTETSDGGIKNGEVNDAPDKIEDDEDAADEMARTQLEVEAESAWQHNTTMKSSRSVIEERLA